ncbi:fragile X mental retardation 1 neighbor protein isoform X2 [Coturnix japonica]|nr:fragile X mental retardation 1 neighbor protein isoform X2 [Coturnix japonica]XP_015716399.1 fragile X mental retardation 1 neighbor protein isoform X2 [Coturnix japonica]
MLQEGIGFHLLWSYVILILLHSVNSSFTSPTPASEKNEVAGSNFVTKVKGASNAFLNLFRPVTCRYKERHTLVPCRAGGNINATKCLENRCCPSKGRHQLECYVPFKDNLQLALRLFLVGALGCIILGCVPLFCCAWLQKSPCINPLRSANITIEQIVKNKRANSEEMRSLLSN